MNQTSKRVGWLDAVRALAILMVICNHSIERAYIFMAETMQSYTPVSRLIALSLFALGRLGVPLFFFLSGYLLLDREYDRAATGRFFRRNFLGLLFTTELWIVFYNLFNCWFYQIPFNGRQLVDNLLFFTKTEMSHMWYMPVILGIYLFLPFVANALRASDVRTLYVPVAVAFFYLFVRVEANVVLGTLGMDQVGSVLDVSFSGGVYGVYLIIGYLAQKGVFDRLSCPVLAVATLLCWGATVTLEWFAYAMGGGYNVWYDNATLLLAGLFLFVLLSRTGISHPVLTSLARCSFGIYLIHNPIMIILFHWIQLPSKSVQFAVIGALTLAISWTLVALCAKNRWIARWLFALK